MSDIKAIELSENTEFGWQLLHHALKNDITENYHLIIVVIHWLLIRNKFRCLGIGSEKETVDTDLDSDSGELLPDGWNSTTFPINLRYQHKGTVYVVVILLTEGNLIVNLFAKKADNESPVSNLLLHPSETVKTLAGKSLNDLLIDQQEFLNRVRRELIYPVFSGNRVDDGTQTPGTVVTKTQSQTTSEDIPRPSRPIISRRDLIDEDLDFSFTPAGGIGSRDVDPLGVFGGPGGFGNGGGMLGTLPDTFNPRGNRRYDPINPFDTRMSRDPNHDHFRPPNNDDMYL